MQGSTVVAAAVFALFLQQCAFVGHDSAHNGITHIRNVDIMIGMVSERGGRGRGRGGVERERAPTSAASIS